MQTESLLDFVVNETNLICPHVKNFIALEAVKRNGCDLQHVKHQTPELCMAAVRQNGHALCYVKEQTPEICMAAVQECGYSLRHVKHQTMELCVAAVNKTPDSIKYADSWLAPYVVSFEKYVVSFEKDDFKWPERMQLNGYDLGIEECCDTVGNCFYWKFSCLTYDGDRAKYALCYDALCGMHVGYSNMKDVIKTVFDKERYMFFTKKYIKDYIEKKMVELDVFIWPERMPVSSRYSDNLNCCDKTVNGFYWEFSEENDMMGHYRLKHNGACGNCDYVKEVLLKGHCMDFTKDYIPGKM